MTQKLKGAWSGWSLTDRSLISPTGRKYGPDTSPAGAVRDAEGRIIGTRQLVYYGA